MSGLDAFGLVGFVMAIWAVSRVGKLERLLRENGITSRRSAALVTHLGRCVGKKVLLSLETVDGDVEGKVCRVLDVDETWALVLANEGRKKEHEKLLRLEDIKQVSVKE